MDIGSVGIGYFRWEIADNFIAGIFQAHSRIAFGPFFADDGIFKSSCFKSFFPVIDTRYDKLTPLLRGRRVYIINYRLFWFHQFTSFVALHILGFWLEAIANDKYFGIYSLLLIGIFVVVIGEITYPRIKTTGNHWLFGHQQNRSGNFECNGASEFGCFQRGYWWTARQCFGCCT